MSIPLPSLTARSFWTLVLGAGLLLALVTALDLLGRSQEMAAASSAQAQADSLYAQQLLQEHAASLRLQGREEEIRRLDLQREVWMEAANLAAERRPSLVMEVAEAAPGVRIAHDTTIALAAGRAVADSLEATEITPLRVTVGILDRELALSKANTEDAVERWQGADSTLAVTRLEAKRWEQVAKKPHLPWREAFLAGAAAGVGAAILLRLLAG